MLAGDLCRKATRRLTLVKQRLGLGTCAQEPTYLCYMSG
jgi:hypothetical protein